MRVFGGGSLQVTTSSCSGRVAVFVGCDSSTTGSKGVGRWAFVCHRTATGTEVWDALAPLTAESRSPDELVRRSPMLAAIQCMHGAVP